MNEVNIQKPKEVLTQGTSAKQPLKKEGSGNISIFGQYKKTIILGIVDLLALTAWVFLLSQLPKKAEEISKIKTQAFLQTESIDAKLIQTQLTENKEKINKLLNLLPQEDSLVNFIKEEENLKGQGLITNFSFASDKTIKDDNNYPVLPFIIESDGDSSLINSALQKIDQLPFLIKPTAVEITKQLDGSIHLKYAGFLYVEQNF